MTEQSAPKGIAVADSWLPTLLTPTPEEGYSLAIKLARTGVKMTQPDAAIRDRLRVAYAENADSLMGASQVIAINFQTVAAANGYWQ